jgi:hypothetical protein
MRGSRKSSLLVVIVAVAALMLAAWAVAGCGGESTGTTVGPETTTTAAATDTTAGETAGGAAGASGAIAVTGMVDNPMTLTVAELEKMTVETLTIEHPKKGATEYTGVRFSAVLEALKVQAAATAVVITASDGFAAEVPLADAKGSADALLVIDEGTIASAFPGLEGQTWVKDIVSMEFK